MPLTSLGGSRRRAGRAHGGLCARIEGVTLTRDQIRALRDRLIGLHKLLLDGERGAYERAYGPVGSRSEWLHLVIEHEHFVWLRDFSGVIVSIDEWLAADDADAGELAELARKVDRLTSISASTDARAVRYRKAINRSADAAVAHAAVRKILDARVS